MRWTEFLEAAPEIAGRAVERIEKPGLALIGTVRRDGSPRVSPCELMVFESDLVLGMMWSSTKALDLLRDPRCVVHSVVSDKNGTEGEVKLRGRAASVEDRERRERYARRVFEESGFEIKEPSHLFALDIEDATYVKYHSEGDQTLGRWRVGEKETVRLRRWNGSGLED